MSLQYKHLKNIFKSGALDEKVVVSILENTTQHGAIEGRTRLRWTAGQAEKNRYQEVLTHAGKIKAEVAKKIAKDWYDEFDSNHKKSDALEADEEDLKELEEIEKRRLNNKTDYE